MAKAFKSTEGMTKSRPDDGGKIMTGSVEMPTGVNMDDNKNWAKVCFNFDRKLSKMTNVPTKVIALWKKMLKRY